MKQTSHAIILSAASVLAFAALAYGATEGNGQPPTTPSVTAPASPSHAEPMGDNSVHNDRDQDRDRARDPDREPDRDRDRDDRINPNGAASTSNATGRAVDRDDHDRDRSRDDHDRDDRAATTNGVSTAVADPDK